MTTPNLALAELAAAQSQPHVTHNQALRALDAVVQLSVISAVETGPPGGPTDGDRYIVASTGTGAWTGHGGEIAYYVAAAAEWRFLDPGPGWLAYDLATSQLKIFSGGSPGGWGTFAGGGGGDAGFTELTAGNWSSSDNYAFSAGTKVDHLSGAQWLYRERMNATTFARELVILDSSSPGDPERIAHAIDPYGSIFYGWGGDAVNAFHVFRGIGEAAYWDGSDATFTSTGRYIAQELPDGAGVAHLWGVGEVDFAAPDTITFRALDDAFGALGAYLAAERTTGGGITKVRLGNLADAPAIIVANKRTSTPGDTLADGEAMLSIVDTGGSQSFHVRYNDGGVYRTGSVALT